MNVVPNLAFLSELSPQATFQSFYETQVLSQSLDLVIHLVLPKEVWMLLIASDAVTHDIAWSAY